MPKLVLYHAIESPSARKVRIAMAEKKVGCQKVRLDLSKGEHRTREYLRLNPHGRVPTLLIDSIPIYESTAIIEYLNETFPGFELLPENPVERARVRMIEETIDGPFLAALLTLWKNEFATSPADRSTRTIVCAREQIAWHNEWLDNELAGRVYLVNGSFSLADIAGLCAIEFQRGLAIGLDPRHRDLVTWYDRMKMRPSAAALYE